MAISVLRYLTANPYTTGQTLAAGDELATPQTSDCIIYMVETSLTFTGGGRTSRYQPVQVGDILLPGIALAATAANTNWCPVRIGFFPRVLALSIHGEDANGNATISIGDTILADSDGELNNDVTNGTPFGLALAAVGSGSTTVIPVLLFPFGKLANA